MNSRSPIGIFDSGLGGLSTAEEIRRQLPGEDLLFFGDSARNPYGTKTREEIEKCSMEIVERFKEQGVKAVVIACNTATSAAASRLRQIYDFDIIGVEPALKVAATAKTPARIAVWATSLTLEEKKFAALMHRFDQDHEIVRTACPKLVRLIEEGKFEDEALVRSVLQEYLDQTGTQNLDAIVLGCTHFVYFKDILKTMVDENVMIVDGNEGTARHLKHLLEQKGLLNDQPAGSIAFDNSDPDKLELTRHLYQYLEERHV